MEYFAKQTIKRRLKDCPVEAKPQRCCNVLLGFLFWCDMRTYKDWPLLEKLPDGWRIDKTCGSPLSGYEFVTNGKNILTGMQKRALLKVRPSMQNLLFDSEVVGSKMELPTETKPEPKIKQAPDLQHAKTVNDLARQKFKHQLLKDILVDLTICEIEGWSKTEYIDELKSLINSIGNVTA